MTVQSRLATDARPAHVVPAVCLWEFPDLRARAPAGWQLATFCMCGG